MTDDIDPERLKELQAALIKIDPLKRRHWQLEVYTRRNNQDVLIKVIDLKTGKPLKRRRQVEHVPG